MPRNTGSSRHHSSRSSRTARTGRTTRPYTLFVTSIVELTAEEHVTLRAGVQLRCTDGSVDQPTADQLAAAQTGLEAISQAFTSNADFFHLAACGTRQSFNDMSFQWKGMTNRAAQDNMQSHDWLRAKALHEDESFLEVCSAEQGPWTKYYEETRKPEWVSRAEREALEAMEAEAPSNTMTAQETYDAEVEAGIMSADELADLAFSLGLE